MSIITLTTDFGLKDHKVASIKGKILSLKKDISIVDISHEIDAHNLMQTAYVVRNAYSYFPEGTIHIISVDSFHHKDRKLLVIKANKHYFICADNGLFTLIFNDKKPEKIYEITLNNRFNDTVNFTTTDVFVPVAVHLQNGGVPELIGREISEIRESKFPNPIFTENQKILSGEVVYIDNFGNLIFNINKDIFTRYSSIYEEFTIKFRNYHLTQIVEKYTDLVVSWEKEGDAFGREMAFFNEAGLLQIAFYKGTKNNGASSLSGMEVGSKIFIEFK